MRSRSDEPSQADMYILQSFHTRNIVDLFKLQIQISIFGDINATFKHCILAIPWRPVFLIGGGSRSTWRKPLTFDRKTGNPSQLRLESSALAHAGFKLTTSVLTGQRQQSVVTTQTTRPLRPLKVKKNRTKHMNVLTEK